MKHIAFGSLILVATFLIGVYIASFFVSVFMPSMDYSPCRGNAQAVENRTSTSRTTTVIVRTPGR
jgi:hypothetical protein